MNCYKIYIYIYIAALLPQLFGNSIQGHTTREPQIGLELATNCIQFYVIANLDKTSLTEKEFKPPSCPSHKARTAWEFIYILDKYTVS